MINKITTIMIIIMGLFIFYTNIVYAYPVDTMSEYLILTDTDGINDDITTFKIGTNLSLNNLTPWSIGIYEFTDDGTKITKYDSLEVLNNNTPSIFFTSAAVTFDLANGKAFTNGIEANIDGTFGMYLTCTNLDNTTHTMYTHSYLNSGLDYFEIYDVLGDSNYGGFHTILHCALTDIGVIDASPAPVPEPTTLLLLGSGLIVMATVGRKKFFK